MKSLVTILLLIALSSCQKELSCEDWGVCEQAPPKCIKGHTWTMPPYNISPYEHLVFTPENNSYHIYAHPDFVATWGDCMPMNVKDSAGWYKVVSKGIYSVTRPDGMVTEGPYVQIGGTDQGWTGHETSTYIFIMQIDEWNTITTIFKPRW